MTRKQRRLANAKLKKENKILREEEGLTEEELMFMSRPNRRALLKKYGIE